MTPLDIDSYIASISPKAYIYYEQLKILIKDVKPEIKVILFAKQPYFYLEEHSGIKFHDRPSLMMAFFKDHVNIFSTANKDFAPYLPMYKFTEKNTMQIYFDQPLEEDTLKSLFEKSFEIHHT